MVSRWVAFRTHIYSQINPDKLGQFIRFRFWGIRPFHTQKWNWINYWLNCWINCRIILIALHLKNLSRGGFEPRTLMLQDQRAIDCATGTLLHNLLTLTYEPYQCTSFSYLPIRPTTLYINKIKTKDFINTSEVLTRNRWTLTYSRKYTHNIFAFETYSFKGLLF